MDAQDRQDYLGENILSILSIPVSYGLGFSMRMVTPMSMYLLRRAGS